MLRLALLAVVLTAWLWLLLAGDAHHLERMLGLTVLALAAVALAIEMEVNG